ncbi:sigma-54-dependent transcriptional regulator [Pajaroellobacter abortibovis]|uniref:Fis family transcriptional regulator n=1 Tax=Pajaroellobacter abortibovis TaxID=1882918 RepID=A0A1L6MWB0_9BACT|nr:sigma-54 dependent transcriptional regulator [Pajaroellobacter abortibovis]APR99812.1 Fis family transcriptional regulator [Pajaroellobacter abortibovis]
MPKILIVDDQKNMRMTMSLMLKAAGYEVEEAQDGEKASELGKTGKFDLILTDLRMGSKDGLMDGLQILQSVKQAQPSTAVMLMTAYGNIENAVEAMRLGAFDYIQKPFTEQELLKKVGQALESRQRAHPNPWWKDKAQECFKNKDIVGRSLAIRGVLARVARIAPTDATVLITGESGTGKELVAKALHAQSRRANRPFISINCATISETLLDSELFGHARGAFTGAITTRKGLFEEAEGGTFFFDEIAETPLPLQAKLLRAIQEKEIRRIGENKPIQVDVRIIAATNQDLSKAIATKQFRQDLYYRLNVVRFRLPPLRERKEDIPDLLNLFLDKYNQQTEGKTWIDQDAITALQEYDFPGNVRELEHMVEQAVAVVQEGVITADDLLLPSSTSSRIPQLPSPSSSSHHPHFHQALTDIVDKAERIAIEQALRESEGNRERAAELLSISSTTLWRKMNRLGIVFENRST